MGGEAFPASGDLAAATSLLLLSDSSPAPPLPSPPPTLSDEVSSYSYSSSFSTASASSARSCVSDSAPRGRAVDPLRVLAVVATLRRVDPKVLAKAKSKLFHGEEAKKRKGVWFEIEDEDEEGENESSAVASEGSAVTAAASGCSTATSRRDCRPPPSCGSGSGGGKVWRKAKAIVEWLSRPHAVPATETAIRAAVGDNADTSKALRLLMKQRNGCRVRRKGSGGRFDPYVYMVAGWHGEVNSR